MEQMYLRTWYRSMYQRPDGELEVWCESSDPDEVRRMSQGPGYIFQKMEFWEVTNGWETWND